MPPMYIRHFLAPPTKPIYHYREMIDFGNYFGYNINEKEMSPMNCVCEAEIEQSEMGLNPYQPLT